MMAEMKAQKMAGLMVGSWAEEVGWLEAKTIKSSRRKTMKTKDSIINIRCFQGKIRWSQKSVDISVALHLVLFC